MHLVQEQHPWHDLLLTFLLPLLDLGIDLVPNFLFYLPGVTLEKLEEPLASGVNHVYFVQIHRMNYLLLLL